MRRLGRGGCRRRSAEQRRPPVGERISTEFVVFVSTHHGVVVLTKLAVGRPHLATLYPAALACPVAAGASLAVFALLCLKA